MKKTLLFSAALFATIAASAQTIVWPSTVNRETKEANLSATVTGSETITATDITLGADIKIGDKDGANAVTAVKNTTGENLQFPSETEGMISWRPINGNVDGAEATADLAEGAGAYIDFTIEEGDINKTFAGMSSFEFDVTKVGTDAIRINVKLIGEGDTNVDTGWLINADNAKSFGDEYQADYDEEAKNKDYPWDEAANGYNPSRNDGSKGVSGGANANGISHVKLAVPAEFAASNPYKVTLRIAIIKCANNKDLGVNAVTFNFGDSTTPVEEEKVYSVIGTLVGNWDVDTDLTKNESGLEGLYETIFENVAAGSYEVKFRQDHDWKVNWGVGGAQDGDNIKVEVEKDGSQVVVLFDPATGEYSINVVAPGEPAGDILSLIDKFTGCWNNAETATANADGTITYNAKQWGGIAAWLAGDTPADYSAYDNIVFEFAEATPCAVQGFVQYGDNTDNKTWIEAGATKAVCALGEGKAAINQIALQCAEDATLTITRIYLEKADETAINAVKAAAQDSDAIYNIAGQKVSASYKGLVIKNGKKYIQK